MEKPGSSIPQYYFGLDCSLSYAGCFRKGQQLGFCWLAQITLNLGQAPLSQQDMVIFIYSFSRVGSWCISSYFDVSGSFF